MSTETATLRDGRTVEFVITSDPPSGGMKRTYFTPDRQQVVQFYHDQNPALAGERLRRLEAIIGRYNPTIEPWSTSVAAEHFKKLFCWPTAIVTSPALGLTAPTYPANYFFHNGPFKGNEKKGRYFTSPRLRVHLPPEEQGSWTNYFQICILLARAVRRLHAAGLAHSDLSSNNILVDPSAGRCIVIDIDSLVVPNRLPPEVNGTPGYIAPEVLSTMGLSLGPPPDPLRRFPSILTDLHALAVLLYEYLLFRHPLMGPKVLSMDPAQDDLLSMGSKALFVEHPTDRSNRPTDLRVPYTALGPRLGNLFKRAFVDGLHNPQLRPDAMDWERALVKTWDSLFPCVNPDCTHKWLVLYDGQTGRCPFCGSRSRGMIPVLSLMKEGPRGHWRQDAQLTVYPGIHLFKWHAYHDQFPGEVSDRNPVARCMYRGDKWLLENLDLPSLTAPSGTRVSIGQWVELKQGAQIRFSQEPQGRMAEVQMIDL